MGVRWIWGEIAKGLEDARRLLAQSEPATRRPNYLSGTLSWDLTPKTVDVQRALAAVDWARRNLREEERG